MTPIRVLVVGHQGRMGQLATNTLNNDPRFTCLQGVGRDDDLSERLASDRPDLVLELSDCHSVAANTQCVLEHGIPIVVGASGLSDHDLEICQRMALMAEVCVLVIPNFSLGAQLMMRCAALIAAWMPDAELIEMHHPQKKDAPSGTALATAKAINEARQKPPVDWEGKSLAGARGASVESVNIHSLRLPGILAKQQIHFGGTGETLLLEHTSNDRCSFAAGILLACYHAPRRRGLTHGLDFIFEEQP